MVITMAKLRMAHASTHGARKLPGPINEQYWLNKFNTKQEPAAFAFQLSSAERQTVWKNKGLEGRRRK